MPAHQPCRLVAAFILVLLASSSLNAQTAAVRARGVAYDSLRGVPLVGAFVTLDGGRSATTDARGQFDFDSVPPGVHTFAAQHAALDSVGLYGLVVRATVSEDGAEVLIATPSYMTLWRAVCGAARPAADSGFVYGAVLDATGAPVADATVDLTWFELGTVDSLGFVQRRWRSQVRSGANGAYAVCGVPLVAGLRVQAVTDSAASGLIDLAAGTSRVRRRDLRVAPFADSAAERRGTIVGMVSDSAGRPIEGARVVADAVPEARSDAAGRFELRGVLAGTRQLEVLAVGMSPATAVADVGAGERAAVSVRLRRVKTLDAVRVTASRRVRQLISAVENRKRSGAGYVRDSTAIERHGLMSTVFTTFPGIEIQRARGTAGANFFVTMRQAGSANRCVPPVWIDGTRGDFDYLNALRAEELAVVEVYPRAMHVPADYASSDTRCGVVAVWTKFALR